MRERWILETKKADFDGLAAKLSVPPLLEIGRASCRERVY